MGWFQRRRASNKGVPFLRVLMVPADQTRDANPFNALLNKALRDLRVCIVSGSDRLAALAPVQILHIHWPHNFASDPSLFKSFARSALLIAACFYHKVLGAKVVWTVHDLESLQVIHPRLEAFLMRSFESQVDGLIFLSAESRQLLLCTRPRLSRIPGVVIPHGLYGGFYPAPKGRGAARKELGLPTDALIVGLLGDFKRYKAIEKVLSGIEELGPRGPLILLAGHFSDAQYQVEVERQIENARLSGALIHFVDRRLSTSDLACMIDAVDAVSLPYSKSLNSGLALLSLERGRPILTSSEPAFTSLQSVLGRFWVLTADGQKYSELLSSFAPVTASQAAREALEQFKEARDWPSLAASTLNFYIGLTLQRET
jgi:beta-1,4-mannosyltransferase